MTDAVDSYAAAFEHQRAALPGGDAMGDIRSAAMARFVERGFPGQRDERWKYTRLDALARQSFVSAEAAGDVPSWLAERAELAPAGCDIVTFVNGHLADKALPTLPSGIRLVALSRMGAGARAMTQRLADADDGVLPSFTALNTALFADGVLLEIDANASLDKPLVLRFVNDASEALAQHPRVIVAAGENARATIMEMHVGVTDTPSFCNAVSQFDLAAGATVEHVKLHIEGSKTQHIGAVRAHVGAGACYHNVALALGGLLTRNDIEIFLDGEGADVKLHGLLLGTGRRHMDYHTLVEHRSPNATSEEIYKAVLNDRSRGVFDGAVRVHKGADGTDATQRSNNLLLSDSAEIDTKPMLEIYADDVKCAHGATVGQLDEDALFYLEARGIHADDARAMLTAGFAQEITDLVPHDGLGALARGLVDEHLGVISDVS